MKNHKDGLKYQDILFLIFYLFILNIIIFILSNLLTEYFTPKLYYNLIIYTLMNIIVVIIILILYKTELLKDIKLVRQNLRKICFTILSTYFIYIILSNILAYMMNSFFELDLYKETSIDINRQNIFKLIYDFPVLWFINSVILIPMAEEVTFRYLLIKKLSTITPYRTTIIINSLIFTYFHSGLTTSFFTYLLTTISIVFVYLKTNKNLIAVIFYHIIINLLSYIGELLIL
ncbi:CPBP family intramembrane glutamic endopeptidase [Miniphocaeibacter halophilus]|uniref:CPBP family intramembrane metalloprotease n=1 Tax=Miniphocaeibacter halophilus TaxID=2931922 RepID=A0AC61MTF1_9FIRM|nr:CPBP family intramembrane glutamic endopeptidase [Miniphocaeibacter halophilus]QQK08902.1 CPBP family intramembrane metalloprotease [Miniphocaeibacter halophilus]